MNLISLIKVYGLNSLGVNKVIYEKDPKKKTKSIIILMILFIAGLVMLGSTFVYSMIISKTFTDQRVLISVMMSGNFIAVFFTSVFLVKGVVFGFSDYDMQMSMPINTKVIIASRLFILYVYNILLTALFFIPANIMYSINGSPSIAFYIMSVVLFFLIPLVPMIIGVFLGLIMQFFLSRIKGGNVLALLLNMVLIGGTFLLLFKVQGISTDIFNQTEMIMKATSKIYPMIPIYIAAISEYNLMKFFLFSILSISTLLAFLYIVGSKFKEINTALVTSKTKRDYRIIYLKSSSVFMTLLKKELAGYFSSTLYVVNTTFGVTIMMLIALAVLVTGEDRLVALIGNKDIIVLAKNLSPLILASLVSFTAISCSSISLEGKNMWILRTIPVKPISIFNSKIVVNLLMTVPVAIITSLVLILRFEFDMGIIILLFVTPVVYALFTGVFGILINLLFPVLQWTSEVVVIKQSISSVIGMLGGLAVAVIPVVLIFVVKSISSTTIISLATIAIGIITIVLYMFLNIKGSKIFQQLKF